MISDLKSTYLLRSVFSSGSDLQALLDPEGNILELNEALLDFTGRNRDSLLTTAFSDLFKNNLTQSSLSQLKSSLTEATKGSVEVRLEQSSQSALDLRIKPILDADDRVKALLVQATTESTQAGSLEHKALSDLPVGVIKLEADGTLSLYNRAAQRMLGLSREQLIGLSPASPHLKISYDDGTPFFEDAWPQHLHSEFEEPPVNILLKVERPLHDTKWLLMTTEVVEQTLETQSYATLSTLTDVTEQRKQEESLRQGALYDPLTALPMRTLFADRLTQVIGKAQRIPRYCFAVLCIDLDNFEAINGAVGHEGGNDILIQVAAQLKESLRSADTLARLSEDEFVILLDDAVVLADAVEVAERSLNVLASCDIGGKALSASIGILMGDKNCSDPYQVLNHSKQAMLEAKDHGKGCYAIYRK